MVKVEIHGDDAKEALDELRALAAVLSPTPEKPASGNDSPTQGGPRRGRKNAQPAQQPPVTPASVEKAPETVPAAPAAVSAAPVAPTAPVASAPVSTAPVASAPAPVAPQPAPQNITLDMISNAGSGLIDQGKMNLVMQLLGKYGVQAITMLPPELYPAFAADLRALGAQI